LAKFQAKNKLEKEKGKRTILIKDTLSLLLLNCSGIDFNGYLDLFIIAPLISLTFS